MAQEISDIKKVRIDGPRRILPLMWLTNGNDSSSRSAGERMPPVRSDRNRRDNLQQLGTNVYLTALEFYSRPDQEEQEDLFDQVQGPMLQAPVHARPEGRREGREAQAVAAP